MKKISTNLIAIVLYTLIHTPILFASENRSSNNLPASLFNKESKLIDISFLISVSEVQNQKKFGQKGFIFIDIRNSRSFMKVKISDSLNIPLFSIKTKEFLKTKRLILVNEGFGYKSMIQECRRLRKNGFTSVYILKGGLNAWHKSGGDIEGDFFAIKDLNIITPHSFFQDKDYDNIIVINIYRPDKPRPKILIPETIDIPFWGDTDRLIDELKETILVKKNNDLLYVMLSGCYKFVPKHIGEIDKKLSDTIFYLKGGAKEYNKFLKNQALIWVPKKQIKTGKKCSLCD